MSFCVSPEILNSLSPFGGNVFATYLHSRIVSSYPQFEKIESISASTKDGVTMLSATIKVAGSVDAVDIGPLATETYNEILEGKKTYHGLTLPELVSSYAVKQDTPAYNSAVQNSLNYNSLPVIQKLEVSKSIKAALESGDIQFNDDSLYKEFTSFVFKTNQGAKWFANLSDNVQHPDQQTIGQVLDNYITYSKSKGVLKYIDSAAEIERKVSILKDKLAGFRVSLEDIEIEEGEGYKQEANMQAASSYAGSQVKLYLSTIKNPKGGYYSSEQLIGMIISDLSGLTDEQVVTKLQDAGRNAPNSYLGQIYNELYNVQPTVGTPKTPLAVLETINDQERAKLRFDFQSFVQKEKTPPLATYHDSGLTILTNKLVENQTYNVRKNINSALIKLASDNIYEGINPIFKGSKTLGKEVLSLDFLLVNKLATTLGQMTKSSYIAVSDSVREEFIRGLFQLGIIPSVFESEVDAQEHFESLSIEDANKLIVSIHELTLALSDVAADKDLKESAHNIFQNQTNQSASADGVPLLKKASNAYDQVIDSIISKNNEFVRSFVYFKDNGSKVYALSLPTTAHKAIANLKSLSKLPYSVQTNVGRATLNNATISEYVQDEVAGNDEELVFSSFQKDDHFRGILALLARGHNPFSRAAERGIQRTLDVDLLDSTTTSALNSLGNRLVYEAVTAIYNRLMLEKHPGLFNGLHFSKVAKNLRQFSTLGLETVLDTLTDELKASENLVQNLSKENTSNDGLIDLIKSKVVDAFGFSQENNSVIVPAQNSEIRNKLYDKFIETNIRQFEKYINTYYKDGFTSERLKNEFGVAFARTITNTFDLTDVPARTIAEKFTAMFVEGKLFEFALVFGDVGAVSATNFNKRATLYQSTKQANLTS
jgi:hypothetical protein